MPAAKKPAKKAASKVSAKKLARAAESGRIDVHEYLAQRQAATLNDDKGELERIDKALAELGYA